MLTIVIVINIFIVLTDYPSPLISLEVFLMVKCIWETLRDSSAPAVNWMTVMMLVTP